MWELLSPLAAWAGTAFVGPLVQPYGWTTCCLYWLWASTIWFFGVWNSSHKPERPLIQPYSQSVGSLGPAHKSWRQESGLTIWTTSWLDWFWGATTLDHPWGFVFNTNSTSLCFRRLPCAKQDPSVFERKETTIGKAFRNR